LRAGADGDQGVQQLGGHAAEFGTVDAADGLYSLDPSR
jgi:hypothetical protein